MSLNEKIKNDLKESMLAHDEFRTTVLRGIIAAFTNEILAKKGSATMLDDDSAIAIIKRLSKQRKDSIEQFTKGNRPELAKQEARELLILESYLPKSMTRDEIRIVAQKKIKKDGKPDKAKIGQFMGSLMKELKGQADGADVKAVIEELAK